MSGNTTLQACGAWDDKQAGRQVWGSANKKLLG